MDLKRSRKIATMLSRILDILHLVYLKLLTRYLTFRVGYYAKMDRRRGVYQFSIRVPYLLRQELLESIDTPDLRELKKAEVAVEEQERSMRAVTIEALISPFMVIAYTVSSEFLFRKILVDDRTWAINTLNSWILLAAMVAGYFYQKKRLVQEEQGAPSPLARILLTTIGLTHLVVIIPAVLRFYDTAEEWRWVAATACLFFNLSFALLSIKGAEAFPRAVQEAENFDRLNLYIRYNDAYNMHLAIGLLGFFLERHYNSIFYAPNPPSPRQS